MSSIRGHCDIGVNRLPEQKGRADKADRRSRCDGRAPACECRISQAEFCGQLLPTVADV